MRRLKICLAGSGGGHLRQLLDLEPVWSRHDAYFVTEGTALGRSLAEQHPVDFVAHYSFGQTRLGQPLRMLRGARDNYLSSLRSLRVRRPDVVLTTGAGAMFATAVLGRARGAHVIAIESFARFHQPSLFGRMMKPFAHDQIVQSAPLAARFPGAPVFDPLKLLDGPRPAKEPLVFATVGATLAYPRLTNAVIEAKRSGAIVEEVVLQTGEGGQVAVDLPGLTQLETLPFDEVQALLKRADIVITHGGTGSIITALREGCRVIALPRRFALGEHYDDHQEQIVGAFAERGLLQRVDEVADLPAALARARATQPVMATTDPSALMAWLDERLERLQKGRF